MGAKKVKLKDLAVFSRQFATMINSGLSLLRALNILSQQTESAELAGSSARSATTSRPAARCRSAMAKHPAVFPPLMVNMCRAGEVGGFLDSVLLQIAANYEAEVKLRGKVKSAMTYPVVVFVMAVLAVIGMLLFIVPVFAACSPSSVATLPLPTQILVLLSGLLKTSCPSSSSAPSAASAVEEVQAARAGAQRHRPDEAQGCRCSETCSRRSRSPGSPATSAR